MRKLFLFFIFIFILTPVFSQENNNEETLYFINSINFETKGMTRSYALIMAGDFFIGEEITGFSKLENYIQNKTQLLYNQRVLESVEIKYVIEDAQEDNRYPVNLTIITKDTWNIIAFPRPKYDSNTGFDLTLKARDYNFFGTMSPLRIDVGYQYDEFDRTFFNLMADSDIPIYLFDLTWYFKLYNYLEYSPDMPEPWFYKNTIGLSLDIPILTTTLNIGFNESFFYNEPNSERNIDLYGLPLMMEGYYLSSNPYISWKIPTGLTFNKYGDVTYTPNLSAKFNHEFSDFKLDRTRIGPFISFSHKLSFGRIDWLGNFLDGISFDASNSYNYDFHNDDITYNINITTITSKNFDNHFSISSRIMYRHWFDYEYGYESAGDVLRGILDKEVTADYMISMNLDLSLRLLRFRTSTFFNMSGLRIFDFDFHVNPFLDAAIYKSSIIEEKYPGTDPSFKNLLMASGVEVIIFPSFFRSFFLRVSLGLNMSTLSGLSSREIYIGTELHY